MIAHAHIQAAQRKGITCLKQAYCTPPFKVANVTEDKKAGDLHLMLMSASPGILDGDDYHICIGVEEQCRVHWHTQSYQRLFNMKKGAQQRVEINLQKNASLVYIPHPSVPHGQSNFTTRHTIHLTESSRLVWGEILTCGRKLNGEQFSFSKYHSITNVYIHDRLAIKENLLVQPAVMNVHAIGQWEGYSHQASLIICDAAANMGTHHAMINDLLLKEPGIAFGISEAMYGSLIVRILGFKGEPLFACLQKIAATIIKPVNTKPAVYAQ